MENPDNSTKEQLLKEIDQLKAEVAELEKSELKSSVWLENSPVCTKIVDLDFNLQYMSSSGVKELKIDDITEFYGKPYPLHFYPDSFKIPMRNNLKKAKETGIIITQEASIVDIEGRELWYHSTIVPVNNDEGVLDYLMVVSLETTDRKQAEEELRESESMHKALFVEAQRFRDALDKVPSYVYMKDIHSRYIYGNQMTLDLFKCSAKELIGCDDSEFFPPDTVKHLLEIDARVFNGETTKEEIDSLDVKGKANYYLEVKSPIVEESNGNKIVGLVGISTDITKRKQVEQVLRESNEEYINLMDSLGTGVVLHAPDSSIILSNPKASEILGISPEQMKGKKAIDPQWRFVRNDGTDLPLEEYPVNKVLRLMKPFTDNFIGIKRPDRKYITWVNVNASIVFDNNNNIKYAIISFNDTTEQKKSEQELKESEERFSGFIKSATDGIVMYNSDLNLVEINAAALKIFPAGTSRDKLIGLNILDIAPSLKESGRYDMYANVIKTGESLLIDDLIPDPQFGDRYLTLKAFKVGDGLGIIFTDITKSKKTEKELKESEKNYRLLAENSTDTIWMMKLDGTFLYHSPAVMQLRGLTPEEANKVSMQESMTPHSIEFLNKIFAREGSKPMKEQWNSLRFELEMFRKDGSKIWTEVTANAVFDDSRKIVGIQGATHDIMERKKVEKELKNHRDHLEELIKERTAEVDEKNQKLSDQMKVFVGREQKIRELEIRLRAIEGGEG